jgi:hypothetical protein
MTPQSHPRRWLLLLLVGLLALGALTSPVLAAESSPSGPAASMAASAAPTVIFAGLFDYVTGSRTRMVQFTFIGFAIGVVILMTSTRKH